MTAIACGRTKLAIVPALNTSNRSLAKLRSRPSAIWLRAELPVQRNSKRNHQRLISRAGSNYHNQTKRGDELAEKLSPSVARMTRERNQRLAKHDICRECSGKSSHQLSNDVRERFPPTQLPLGQRTQGHRRIEMRA